MYGSAAQGPYNGLEETPDTPFVNTNTRMPRALTEYFQKFGAPDRIVYNCLAWDVLKHCTPFHLPSRGVEECPLDAVALDTFITNTNARLDQVLSFLAEQGDRGQGVKLALRTTAWVQRGGELMQAFNDALRTIAVQRKLELFDYDTYVWSKVDFNISEFNHLFADTIHPRDYIAAQYVEVMAERRFTKFAHFYHTPWCVVAMRDVFADKEIRETPRAPLPFLFTTPLIRAPAVGVEDSAENFFFFDRQNGLRYKVPSLDFLRNLYLAPPKAISFDFIDHIAVGRPIPQAFFEQGNVLYWDLHPKSYSTPLFLVSPRPEFPQNSWLCLSELASLESAQILTANGRRLVNSSDFRLEDQKWLRLLSLPVGADIPDVIHNTLLELSNGEALFLIRDYKVHHISSDALNAIGRDPNQATRMRDRDEFLLLTTLAKGDDIKT